MGLYRFDDQLGSAAISAPSVSSATDEAEPIAWEFDTPEIAWDSLSGRMGFRPPGELVVKGEGQPAAIVSPESPPIDWTRYESLLIRMVAAGGRELKLSFPQQEYRQPLAPPMEYRVYRFDLNLRGPAFQGRLTIVPTDSANQIASIDYVRLIPRRRNFPSGTGITFSGKQSDYRRAIYVHSPSSLTYELPVARGARLRFAVGISDASKAVDFRIRAGSGGDEIFRSTVRDAGAWQEQEVELREYDGQSAKIVFETAGPEGGIGLWANPLLSSPLPKGKPNILLYLVDTLRADHTSLHGYARDTTPFLKALGARGVVFDNCHAQSTWTKPSVASLLTSLHTGAHGVHEFVDSIPEGAGTLAETLRAAGYVTASIVANPFSGRNSGLERGVDHLIEYPVIHRHRVAAEGATDSGALNRVVFPWLERHRSEPFFLYAHATDPHAPYRPPRDTEAKFANPAETAAFERDYNALRQAVQAYGGGAVFSPAAARAKGIDPEVWARRAIDRYDAETAFNDRSIEALAAKLKELGVLDNTLIVVVSDHGEEFLEHGWTTHGHSLYDELTHVVCMMWNPRLLPEARRFAEPVQLIDVMPTILDIAGVPPMGVIQGQSLAPLIYGEPFERKGPVMASRFADRPAPPPGQGIPEARTGTIARIDAAWKLIYREQAATASLKEVELYDRRKGGSETYDVAPGNPQTVRKLTEEIRQWTGAQKQVRSVLGPGKKTTLDPETLERLRTLGYIGGKGP